MLFSLPTDESLVDLRLPERRLDSGGDFPVSDTDASITIWLWLVQSIDLIDCDSSPSSLVPNSTQSST